MYDEIQIKRYLLTLETSRKLVIMTDYFMDFFPSTEIFELMVSA